MYKDKKKEQEASKERMRRYRARKGVTEVEGVTALTSPLEGEGVTYPDIIDKLTDPFWRGRLEKICNAMRKQDREVSWLGNLNLSTVCDLLECVS